MQTVREHSRRDALPFLTLVMVMEGDSTLGLTLASTSLGKKWDSAGGIDW